MRHATAVIVIAAVAVVGLAQTPARSAPGATSAAAALPKFAQGAYTDLFNGFSLMPPSGTERVRQRSPRKCVEWVKRDAKGNVLWRLEILRVHTKPTELSLDKYAQSIAEQFRKDLYQVDKVETGEVAGKPAMHFRGVWNGAVKLWRRQSWVSLGRVPAAERPAPATAPTPAEAQVAYLVVAVSGDESAKAEMDQVATAACQSLVLFDPEQARKVQAEALARGAAALGAIDDVKLAAALTKDPYYFVMQVEGKPIGFLKITEGWAEQNDGGPEGQTRPKGLHVMRVGASVVKGEPRQLSREDLFASADRVNERWRRTADIIDGDKAMRGGEEALKQDSMLLTQTMIPGRQTPESHEHPIPKPLLSGYLPQAFDVVLPRLLDRSKPGSWSFTMYNPTTQDFEMRTVTVVGPEKLAMAGKSFDAVKMTDQLTAMDEPSTIWVDATGLPLRMVSPQGVTVDRTTRESVTRLFATELTELEK